MVGSASVHIIDAATHRYTWKGVRMVKSPFDLALIPLVLWSQKPRTIFEFGTYLGASAMWLSDLCAAMDFQPRIYSVDRAHREMPEHVLGVTWVLGDVETMDFSALQHDAHHPWLVLDDADHQATSVRRVLDGFADGMEPGDRFIVEDGIVEELGLAGQFGGGPRAATAAFLEARPDFRVDRTLCDFWGPNVTWNPDGYLVKVSHA